MRRAQILIIALALAALPATAQTKDNAADRRPSRPLLRVFKTLGTATTWTG